MMRSVCLPSELRAEELLKAETRGFVTGWGNTEEAGDYSRYLRRVRFIIIINSEEISQLHYFDGLRNGTRLIFFKAKVTAINGVVIRGQGNVTPPFG